MSKPKFLYPRLKADVPARYGDPAMGAGSIPHYVATQFIGEESATWSWHEAEPFPSSNLTFLGFSRGRSAAHATFATETSVLYTVFLRDLADLISEGHLEGPVWMMLRRWKPVPAKVVGHVVPVKRGANFGIRALRDAEFKALHK